MKIIKIFMSLGLLLLGSNLFAQYKITGFITEQNNQNPIAGATIYLPDLKTGAVSDTDGSYQISNLKKGSYLLEIRLIGFKTKAQRVELSSDTVLNFQLEASATELNEMVVTGVTHSTELKRNPTVITTINPTQLSEAGGTNIIDALKEVPGISQITTGPNISKPIIRGLGYNRVITLNNGIKQEGQQWGDEHGLEIDQYSVDRVEIIKGPGSLMYGSDGIAGVINFLPPKPLLNGEIKTSLLSNFQSNNRLLGYSLVNQGNKNGFQWLGRFSNKIAGNYSNPYDGRVLNSGFKEYDGNLLLGVTKNWGHVNLSVSSFNTQLGIVEGDRDSLGRFTFENKEGETVSATPNDLSGYGLGVPYQWVNHLEVASNSYFILNKGSIDADFGFQNNRRREFEEAEQPKEEGLALNLNTFNYRVKYNLETMKGWATSIGIGGMFQSNKNEGVEFLIPNYNLFDFGVFVYTEKTWDKLTFAGGLRFDNRVMNGKGLFLDENGLPTSGSNANAELKFASFDHNYNGFSGSVGLSYQLSPVSTLKFNLSQGFRAPNAAELASNGNHEGTFRYEIGNPNLKSEISRQIDLAYYLNSEHVVLQISPFVNFIDHYSYLEKLQNGQGGDSIPDPQNPVPAYQYTSGLATLLGGEVYMDWHPHPIDWLHIENSFSYVQATQKHQTDSTKYLPFIPAAHYRGGLKAEFDNLNKTFSNFYVALDYDYYFAQNKIFSAYGTETATPAYGLLSAGIGLNLNTKTKKDLFQFIINVENLTNKAYQDHLNRLKYADINQATGRVGVFNMGRSFNFKVIVNI